MRTLPPYTLRTSGVGHGLSGGGSRVTWTPRWLVTVTYASGDVTQQEITTHFESMAVSYARSNAPRGAVIVKVDCVRASQVAA